MNKYNNNNFPRAPGADLSPMRFNKRPRYATNSSGGSNSPRYNYQKQSGYQFSSNRSNATDNFQNNQFEKSQRYYYDNSPKRNNYSQPQSKQSSNFSHKSTPSSSKFSPSTQNDNLSPRTERIPAKKASATITGQNQHQQIFTPNIAKNSNYFGYPFSCFHPSYNGDLSSNTSSSVFGGVDSLSSYMWQTIKSTPPPKLQQQPPPPQQQPPALPPLPSSEIAPLPPPPPIPASITDSASLPTTSEILNKNKSSYEDLGSKTIVKMKAKRKAMSTRYKLSKSWSEKDALLALKAEEANAKKTQKDFILIIRFPDPEISREIVRNYSPDIESVHFHLNFAPRCCLIHLKPGTDVEKTIDHLSKIKFGTGYLSVEIKQIPHKTHSVKLNEVDPFTLYVGNLPTTIACKTLKEYFPGAARIDIGFAQRMKYTRYAFIRYQTVHLAIEAYNRMLDAEIGGRTLTIRFRRLTAAYDGNKDADPESNVDIHDDLLVSQTTVTDCDSNELATTGGDDSGTNASLLGKNNVDDNCGKVLNDTPNLNEKEVAEGNKKTAQGNISLEHDSIKTNESVSLPVSCNTQNEKNTEETPNAPVKPEPEVDANDVVTRSNMIARGCESNENPIKQELEKLAMYEELFERPQTQSDCSEKSSRSDLQSTASITDDMDAISQLSSNSLKEFLQTCQRSQTQAKNNVRDAEKSKVTIKKETLEADNLANRKNSLLSSKASVGFGCLKQEAEELAETNTSAESIPSITNKSNPLSRKRPNTNISQLFHNNTVNNDDIVPPTALFFTSEYHNKWINSRKDCGNEDFYDEFYETRVSAQTSTSHVNVKTEPLDISICRESKKKIKRINQSNSVSDSNNRSLENSNRNSTAMPNEADNDDDLVPEQNLLGSYRPLNNVIKQETEYDDLFSVQPLSNNVKTNTNVNEVSLSSTTAQSNERANISEISKSHVAESNDEDVVIVFANIPPASKEKKSESLAYNNLFMPRLTDLVSFNYKSFSVAVPSYEASTLFQRDHLDKLYDQLNADSDNEL